MKKFLLSVLSALPILCLNAFAAPVSLSLFQDGLSILDMVFLCGVGIVLLGVLFLCIAFFKSPSKKEKPVDSPFDVYLEEDLGVEETDTDDAEESSEDRGEAEIEPESESEDAAEEEAEDQGEAVAEDDLTENPDDTIAEETEPETEVEAEVEAETSPETPSEPEEEIIYPKLILTHTQTNDFVILPLYPETTVGRKSENDLVLSDVTVSGLHCKIINEDGAIYVLDENSTNGTFVNGERISEKTQLHHGDKLALGKQEFSVSVRE